MEFLLDLKLLNWLQNVDLVSLMCVLLAGRDTLFNPTIIIIISSSIIIIIIIIIPLCAVNAPVAFTHKGRVM